MIARIVTYFKKKYITVQDSADVEKVTVAAPMKYMWCEFTREEAINVLCQLDEAEKFPCRIYMPRLTELQQADNQRLLKEGLRDMEFPEIFEEADGEEIFVQNPITRGFEFNGKQGLEKFFSLLDKYIREAQNGSVIERD